MTTTERVQMQRELTAQRELVREEMRKWKTMLAAALERTSDGHERAHLAASATQVGSAERVLWFEI
jgi:hypothetical protein